MCLRLIAVAGDSSRWTQFHDNFRGVLFGTYNSVASDLGNAAVQAGIEIEMLTAIISDREHYGLPWPSMRKKMLLVFFGLSLAFAGLAIYARRLVRAAPDERARTLAGDDLIPQPIGSVNHAISIHRPPRDVWPWLVQMGSNRAGWYAYDFIDNGGHATAERILSGYQEIRVGTVFPALPAARDVFVVAQCEPERGLVLSWRLSNGQYQTT